MTEFSHHEANIHLKSQSRRPPGLFKFPGVSEDEIRAGDAELEADGGVVPLRVPRHHRAHPRVVLLHHDVVLGVEHAPVGGVAEVAHGVAVQVRAQAGLQAGQQPPPGELQRPAHVDKAALRQLPVELGAEVEAVPRAHLALHPAGLRGEPPHAAADGAAPGPVTGVHVAGEGAGVPRGERRLHALPYRDLGHLQLRPVTLDEVIIGGVVQVSIEQVRGVHSHLELGGGVGQLLEPPLLPRPRDALVLLPYLLRRLDPRDHLPGLLRQPRLAQAVVDGALVRVRQHLVRALQLGEHELGPRALVRVLVLVRVEESGEPLVRRRDFLAARVPRNIEEAVKCIVRGVVRAESRDVQVHPYLL